MGGRGRARVRNGRARGQRKCEMGHSGDGEDGEGKDEEGRERIPLVLANIPI